MGGKERLETEFRKILHVFMCTTEVQPVLVKIFIFGIQTSHFFFSQARRVFWPVSAWQQSCDRGQMPA